MSGYWVKVPKPIENVSRIQEWKQGVNYSQGSIVFVDTEIPSS